MRGASLLASIVRKQPIVAPAAHAEHPARIAGMLLQ
jgi:hypothetical protein